MSSQTQKGKFARRCGQPLIHGYKIICLDTVSSTNEKAKGIARKGSNEKLVLLAEAQTRSKGRMGRKWISPKGGLWFSLILRPRISSKEIFKLTFIMSSAIAQAIKEKFKLRTKIKWPNDVLVNGKKLCGILTEASIKGEIVQFVIIGVGINTNIDLEAFPENLRKSITSLKHLLGYKIKQKLLIKCILQNFEHRYRCLQQGSWDVLLEEWRKLSAFLAKQVKIVASNEVVTGEAIGVGDDGALIIRLENGVLKRILEGDLTLEKTP